MPMGSWCHINGRERAKELPPASFATGILGGGHIQGIVALGICAVVGVFVHQYWDYIKISSSNIHGPKKNYMFLLRVWMW